MDKIFPLVAIVMFAMLGCSSKERQRSGMGSPMSLDSAPVKVQVGGVKLDIPQNCFDSPLEPDGESGEYIIDRDVLLTGLLPNIECRTQDNIARFNIVGEGRPEVTFLVSSLGAGRTGAAVLKKNYLSISTQNSRYIKGSFSSNGKGSTETASVALNRLSDRNIEWRDIFGSPDYGGFVYCSRSIPKDKYSGRAFVGNCRQELLFNDLIVYVTYGRNWVTHRDKISAEIARKIQSFHRGNPDRAE
ncbi:MAG: hypothetical protein ABI810_17455 [Sphingomonas bacterium]